MWAAVVEICERLDLLATLLPIETIQMGELKVSGHKIVTDPSQPISPEVKDLAYAIDPPCWVSYSGKPKEFKQQMERRRQVSLAEADRRLKEEESLKPESPLNLL